MYTREQMKQYLQNRLEKGWTMQETDADHVCIVTPYAAAEVIFHPLDIVEMQITNSADQENCFYLHFQLDEEAHAVELMDEMLRTLKQMQNRQVFRVLLTCTSALTTSYFAAELNRAASDLKLKYHFDAVPLPEIYEKGFDYDAILIAPQAGYAYDRIHSVFLSRIVLKIPASVYGQYSTGGIFELLMEAISKKKDIGPEALPNVLRSVFDNPYRILSVCLINHQNEYRIGYRIYDHGKKTLDKEVIKPSVSLQDIDDLIGYVLVRHKKIDAIGLALPGIAHRGVLFHKYDWNVESENIGIRLSDKYSLPVILSNDVNAVAMGYFAVHEKCENMVFHFQPRGFVQAGAGIILNSHLHRGYKSAAGEVGDLIEAVVENGKQKTQTPEGMLEIVGKAMLSYISILAPEKIVYYCDLLPDPEVLRTWLRQYVTEDYIPSIIHVTHIKEYMVPGAMIHALEVLGKDPEAYIREHEEQTN